jgi:UDP-galactopyranose mutase
MKEKTDFLIIGSGFYGSVLAERISNILNKKVVIIDKRDHIGGNCFSTIDKKTKIEYHKYGTHIFHTSSEKVWKYISNFCSLNSYRHQVLSNYKGKIYQLPINLETINSFFKKKF